MSDTPVPVRLCVLIASLATLSCATDRQAVAAVEPMRIVAMGDSITVGCTDNPAWNEPYKFGYRSGLYTRMTDAGYSFQLVGGSTEPWTGISGDPTHGGTYKPALDLRDLGQDGHRGYGGQSVGFLNANILNWLAADAPGVILLKIGTNSQDPAGLNALVNTITTQRPDAHLFVAMIMPKFTYQQGIANYNAYIRDTLVPNYQAAGKHVHLVDLYSIFLTDPDNAASIDQSLFSNGINHPDNDGYDRMAQAWFEAIRGVNELDAFAVSAPAPAALPAGLVLLGLLGLRRRTP